jgi:DNA-binding NarL/FixJ family response regulator
MSRGRTTERTVEDRASPRKILIVDDHPLIRDALKALLGRLPGWQVIGQVSTAREALVLVTAQTPDVVLMDIGLPGMDGVIATREVLRRSPTTRVLVLTTYVHPWDVREALAAGASGYLLKSDSDALEPALEAVVRGERYLSAEVAQRMAAIQEETSAATVLASLSEREREIFRLAAECLTNGQIARELCIARKTVDTHLYRIHRKLDIRTSAELVRLAVSLGVVHTGLTRAGAGPDADTTDLRVR